MPDVIELPRRRAEQLAQNAVRELLAEHIEDWRTIARKAAQSAPVVVVERPVTAAVEAVVNPMFDSVIPAAVLRIRGKVDEDALPIPLRAIASDAISDIAGDVWWEAVRAREAELAEILGTSIWRGDRTSF